MDEIVSRKAAALLDGGIKPIVCVGESLEDREADRTEQVVRSQMLGSLEGLADRVREVVIAYEPVWAIGTGRTATPEQAQEVHAFLRGVLRETYGGAVADAVRIQYGGSVKPGNARTIFDQPDVDGGLIGGASLDAESFVAIVRAAAPEPLS
jgi:triosephosphate isomerase